MYFYRQYPQNSQGCSPGCLILLLILFLMGGFKPLLVLFGIIGILFPSLLFLIPLILLLLLGHRRNRIQTFINTRTDNQNQFVELFVRLLAILVKADGAINPKEISAIRHYFQYTLHQYVYRMFYNQNTL